MAVELYRVDDRLIHGQVVVGWAQPMGARFIVLVDDNVAVSDWEQELYRMGVPPDIEVSFLSVADACRQLPAFQNDSRRGLLITGDVRNMTRLHECSPSFTRVNLGGVHTGPGRAPCLRYVFLSDDEADELRRLANRGVTITAQDLPACPPTELDEVLRRRKAS
jgi:PTS system mannose-specific IIB component/fructoselysine and glucoselysine-specific PTS system IIB component